jgi:hypothetical protein
MTGVATAIVGSAVVGGVVANKAAKKGAEAQTQASEAGIAEQRAAREAFEERTQPFVDIGLGVANDLTSFLDDPSAGLEQINPVANFLQQEGFRKIREGGAGGGRNVDRDLSEFQTGLTSTLVPQFQNQRFNQLFNVLGLGQNAAVGQGNAALQTGANVSNLLGNIGQAQAAGAAGQSNAITGTLQNLSGAAGAFPNLFNRPGGDFAGAVRPPAQGGGVQQGPFSAGGVF